MKTIPGREIILLGVMCALSLGGFLLVSHYAGYIGFPLDDAWIHQTYARNLANGAGWAFIPGQPSGGSTSPLWSVCLAIGYLLRLTPMFWTFALGWLTLWGLSLVAVWVYRFFFPRENKQAIWIGGLFLAEWHLVWAAGSGMETLLFSLLILVVIGLILRSTEKPGHGWIIIGGLIGLSVWLRPDGITLMGIAVWVLVFASRSWSEKLRASLFLMAGFGLIFSLYLWFNHAVGGSIWPNTFYAKQAEYFELQKIALGTRLLRQYQQPLIGVGASLLPGYAVYSKEAWTKRQYFLLAPVIWVIGFLSIYAWRLPVTYQHGRYIIPVMPVYFLVSMIGVITMVKEEWKTFFRRVWMKSWVGVIGIITVGFWILGAKAYARDVAFIESEMVTVAHWLNSYTPENALIAVHDIGAIGYYGNRNLIDLAGLISPEVVPFIRDEVQLSTYLDSRGTDYLVTFPGWYPDLVDRSRLVYRTNSSICMEGENMGIYQWLVP